MICINEITNYCVLEIETVRMIIENRPGLYCKPYLTFLISEGERETIPFSVGKFLNVNGLENL